MGNLLFDIRGNLQPSEIIPFLKGFVALKIDKTWKI
jgi:hypothetical protein